jgi:hypothetical protein
MSIRDIIEAATPGPWSKYPSRLDTATTVVDFADRDLCDVRCSGSPVDMHYATTRFIATFDPEHVALMEAVCEAARDGIPCQHEYASSACLVAMREDSLCTTSTCNKALCAALAAIAAYRKERGLWAS